MSDITHALEILDEHQGHGGEWARQYAKNVLGMWDKDPNFPIQSPKTAAAVTLYVCLKLANEHKSQKEIADIFGVAASTISARHKEILEYIRNN